jgi:hypothetical protein
MPSSVLIANFASHIAQSTPSLLELMLWRSIKKNVLSAEHAFGQALFNALQRHSRKHPLLLSIRDRFGGHLVIQPQHIKKQKFLGEVRRK